MRTLFHHQPQAQHPKSFSYPQERRPITPSFGGKADLAEYLSALASGTPPGSCSCSFRSKRARGRHSQWAHHRPEYLKTAKTIGIELPTAKSLSEGGIRWPRRSPDDCFREAYLRCSASQRNTGGTGPHCSCNPPAAWSVLQPGRGSPSRLPVSPDCRSQRASAKPTPQQ